MHCEENATQAKAGMLRANYQLQGCDEMIT
jgi:hypothetical protein